MFPTGYGELIVTPPLALPPGRDLPPDLVLGLALCDVLRLLDLPTLAPFSVPAAFGARVSYRLDPHTRSPDTGGEPGWLPQTHRPRSRRRSKGSRQMRSRMRVLPGMRLHTGRGQRFLEVRICCCGRAR